MKRVLQFSSFLILFTIFLSCENINTDESLNGNNLNFVESKYGAFDVSKEIEINRDNIKELYEYQNRIIENFPEINKGKTIVIQEYVKDISNHKRIVIWLKYYESDWLVFDNIIFNIEEIKF
ncbi:hypothetical protein [Aureivirga sp. CE67]|uniref:hypothetical protein n=1 Tax=Aureivirga sp. CE67 TaxID=1788983 RepID=UPI0018C9118B|nr:hypothetical protein [Aureivirga sp. CE67]